LGAVDVALVALFDGARGWRRLCGHRDPRENEHPRKHDATKSVPVAFSRCRAFAAGDARPMSHCAAPRPGPTRGGSTLIRVSRDAAGVLASRDLASIFST